MKKKTWFLLIGFLIAIVVNSTGCGCDEVDDSLTCTPCGSANTTDCVYGTCLNHLFTSTTLAGQTSASDSEAEVDDIASAPSSEDAQGEKIAITTDQFTTGAKINATGPKELEGFSYLWSSKFVFASSKDCINGKNKKCEYGTFTSLVINPAAQKSKTIPEFENNIQKIAQEMGLLTGFSENIPVRYISAGDDILMHVASAFSGNTANATDKFVMGSTLDADQYMMLSLAIKALKAYPISTAQELCRALPEKSPAWDHLKAYVEDMGKGESKTASNADFAGNACPANPPVGGGFTGGGSGLQSQLENLADVRDIMGNQDQELKKQVSEQQKSENAATDGGTLASKSAPSGSGLGGRSPSSGDLSLGNLSLANPQSSAAGGAGDLSKSGLSGGAASGEAPKTGGLASDEIKASESNFASTGNGSGGSGKSGFSNPFGMGRNENQVVSGSAANAQYGNLGPTENVYTGDIEAYLAKNGNLSLFQIVNQRMNKWGSVVEGERRVLEMKKIGN